MHLIIEIADPARQRLIFHVVRLDTWKRSHVHLIPRPEYSAAVLSPQGTYAS